MKCFALQRRLAGNPRFFPYNVALGDAIQTVLLFEYESSVLNSLVPDAQFAVRFDKAAQTLNVSCTTLDEFSKINFVDKIDVLKIDTEGYDLLVLRGAQKMLLAGTISFIYIEFNSILEKVGTTGGALLPVAEFLVPFGFRFIASYTDHVIINGDVFIVANALFALPPAARPVID